MLFWIGLASVLMFFGSIAVAWILVVRIPTDYFTNPKPREKNNRQPLINGLKFVTANLIGLGLLVAGLIMLLTPGQGIMFIFLGIVVMDFPGKRKLVRRMLGNEKILTLINRIRNKAGKASLETPKYRTEQDRSAN